MLPLRDKTDSHLDSQQTEQGGRIKGPMPPAIPYRYNGEAPRPVPADATSTCPCRPAARSLCRSTPSAVGERQMLPMQTINTRVAAISAPRCPAAPR